MIYSMTAYIQERHNIILQEEKIEFSIEIKSLNSKYLELNLKVPSVLSAIEIKLHSLIKAKLLRGNICFSLKFYSINFFNKNIAHSEFLLEKYISSINQIKKKFNIESDLTLSTLLNLPNVFQFQEEELDVSVIDSILKISATVVEKLLELRKKEGLFLAADLKKILKNIVFNLIKIKNSSLIAIENEKQLLCAYMQEFNLLSACNLFEKANLENKINNCNIKLEKIDINEEIVRLNFHLAHFAEILKSKEILKGKKCDFIVQEMSREINTIAAKSNENAISRYAIEIKSDIEKLKEQLQNIL